MPTEKTVTLYRFSELPPAAKDTARAWLRDAISSDWNWDYIYEDAEHIGQILGIELHQKPVKLMGGGTRYTPIIWFSGFHNQGDGACFEGIYYYVKGAAKAIRREAPTDTVLHALADDLQALQRKRFYRLSARTSHSGHYYHSGCMSVETFEDEEDPRQEDAEAMTDILRAFADWIYAQLRAEYEYQTSDEAIDAYMEANEYTFTIDGRRED